MIVPIERMMATIVALQQNPLAKASLSNNGNGGGGSGGGDNDQGGMGGDHNNETGMLERTLEKLTGLLQVGFGEAGSRMIQKCMNLNADGDLDPLVDGTKMLAIFGFCDIRRFTDATECLREDVMMSEQKNNAREIRHQLSKSAEMPQHGVLICRAHCCPMLCSRVSGTSMRLPPSCTAM